jgi:hypothetical protein
MFATRSNNPFRGTHGVRQGFEQYRVFPIFLQMRVYFDIDTAAIYLVALSANKHGATHPLHDPAIEVIQRTIAGRTRHLLPQIEANGGALIPPVIGAVMHRSRHAGPPPPLFCP